MPLNNKTIAHRLYNEVWNERNLGLVDELMSPSHALHHANESGSQIGPQAYKATVTRFVNGFPDLEFTVNDIIVEGNKLAVAWTMAGTHRGEFYGVPPTNRKMSAEGITIHLIEKGKILESYSSWDTWGLMRQIGAANPLRQSSVAGG